MIVASAMHKNRQLAGVSLLTLATLLFAVGVKEAPAELLCYVIRNNHDNPLLLDDVQKIFDKVLHLRPNFRDRDR